MGNEKRTIGKSRMTQFVTMDDGSVHEFPDEATPEMMKKALKPIETSGVSSFINRATNTMTFGLNKPFNAALEAGIDTVRGNGAYGENFDKYMKKQGEIEHAELEQHPVEARLGNAAGFFGSLAPMVSGPIKAVQAGITPMKQVLNNAALGAGVGEINAVANTPGSLENKVASAYPAGIQGAGIGAVVPLAAQGIATGVSKAVSPLVEYFKTTSGDKALQQIAKAFGYKNITPEQASMILEHSPGSTLADVGGENVLGLGRKVVNQPGQAKDFVTNFLLGRQKGIGGRIQDMVKTGFNNNANYYDTANNLIATRQQAAQPLYKQAYQANLSMQSPELNRILATPAGSSALKDSVRIMQNNRKLVGMSDPELVEQAKLVGTYEPGSGGIAPGLNMETLDNTKKALDLAYKNSGYKDNSILSVKNDLLAEMDKLDSTAKAGPNSFKPEGGFYKQGRQAFSSPSQSLDALEAGRNFMKDDAEISAANLANIDPADRPFFQIGASRALADRAADNPTNLIKNVLGNDKWKSKLQTVMPSQNDYFDFLTAAQNEANQIGTKNSILGNSTTTKQLGEVAEDNPSMNLPLGMNVGNAMDLAHGNWMGTAMQGGKWAFNKATAPKPEVASNIAQMLFNTNPIQNQATIDMWKQLLQPKQQAPFSLSPWSSTLGLQGAYANSGQ